MIPFALIGVAGSVIFSQVALSLYNLTLKNAGLRLFFLNAGTKLILNQNIIHKKVFNPLSANFELIKQI